MRLSSTESDFYSLISAACDSIFMKGVVELLLDEVVTLVLRADSPSCEKLSEQLSQKQSVSKIRHLDGRFLWIQDHVTSNMLEVSSVDGRRNPSDLETKVPAAATA